MNRKIKNLLILLLLMTNVFIYSESDIFKLTWDSFFQGIANTEEWTATTDNNGLILFNFPDGYTVKVDEASVFLSGKKIKSSIRRNINKYIIKTDIKPGLEVRVNIQYKILSFFNKSLIINDTCFYFPLDLVEKINHIKSEVITIHCSMNKNWQLLEPGNIEYKIQNRTKIYQFNLKNNRNQVLLLSRNINIISDKMIDNVDYKVIINKEYFFIPSLLKSNKNIKTLIERIDNYKKFIIYLYGMPDTIDYIQVLTVQLAFMSLPVGNTIVLNEMYLQSILTPQFGSPSAYHVLKSIAMLYLQTKFKDLEVDQWLLEALSHYAAAEYMRINYGKEIGELPSIPIASFFAGKKSSQYSSTGAKFRDFYRFGSLDSIDTYNKDPLIEYNYRTQAVYIHYGLQVIEHLKNITGNDVFNNTLRHFLNSSKNLTGKDLFEYFKLENNDTLSGLEKFTKNYPQTDYVLSIRKGAAYLKIIGDIPELPIAIEFTDQNNKKERIIIKPENKLLLITDKVRDYKNIRIDPDNIVEELNEANNTLILDFHFSIIAPPIVQNAYAIALNQSFMSYKGSNYTGLSLSGGWNLKSFNFNSANRPFLFWSLDGGYSPEFLSKLGRDDFYFNTSFETTLYPKFLFSPQGYLLTFANSEGMIHKLGFQGFLPPFINTEYDNFFFNQSVDVCSDLRFNYLNTKDMIFSISSGYKNFYKVWFFSVETLNGFNVNFRNQRIKTIDAGGTLHSIINLDFIIIENITGIIKTFYIENDFFDNKVPSLNRGNTVIHTSSYFDKIVSKLSFPQGIGVDFNVNGYDYIFNSFNISFNFPLFKEPFMDPMITQGLGFSEDTYFSFSRNDYPVFKTDLLSASFVMGIQRRIMLSLKIPVFSSTFIYNGTFNYKPGFSFEVRSYL